MAGLTAAWSLSSADCRDEYDVTVYQRGWRLGGKGASSRGVHGRIEEHGLHVWLGYYDNAFRLIREVYKELDREASDPSCPIATWRHAFMPIDRVGVEDRADGSWSHWVATFTSNDRDPGTDDDGGQALSVAAFVRRGLRLLLDFSDSIRSTGAPSGARSLVLSGSPEPPGEGARFVSPAGFSELLRRAEIAAMVGAVESIRLLRETVPRGGAPASFVLGYLDRLRDDLLARVRQADDARRAGELVDLVISGIQGAIRDGLLTDPAGFAAIDHLDFRDWLASHGAREDTLESSLVRGMYDLVFAYEDGDAGRPRFAAGLGLFLAGRLFFEYKGSIFWRMEGGMGDVVFAPLYQALQARGVRFAFFHRVDRLHLADDGSRVEAITVGRQARSAKGWDRYEPLARVKGLPCFRSTPDVDQLAGPTGHDLESHWGDRTCEEEVQLAVGADFDDVVLATSLGMVPHVCSELIEDSPRWRDLVNGVATVPTQSLQVWLRKSERELGWPNPGVTVSGYVTPFDTYASMSHLLAREDWPEDDRPATIGYFCSVLPRSEVEDAEAAHGVVRANAVDHLNRFAGHFWPHARADSEGFQWDLLCGADGSVGDARIDSQYWRANVDPSDEYVQSLPGSSSHRLRADQSGYDNLFLAGDWINCGLNAGCIESAVLAGIQAANALRRLPLTKGTIGTWYGLDSAESEVR
jgi:uncharacterized protein with NAD-binding domain and iron-sulfur cluster